MSSKHWVMAVAVAVSSILVGSPGTSSANTAARVVSVTTTSPNGTYKVGQQVAIDVNFSEPVAINGGLSLLLETGVADRIARSDYGPARTAQTLTFHYTVQVGDRTKDLDAQSTSALFLGDATVASNGIAANLTLPAPGLSGSLSAGSTIVVDGRGVEEQWQNPFSSVLGLHGIVLAEDIRENVSWLIEQGSSGPVRYCSSMSAEGCAGKDLEFRAVVPMCVSDTDVDCIASVTGTSSATDTQIGKLDSLFPKRGVYDFAGNAAAGLPTGTGTSIMRFPAFPFADAAGVQHDTYAVTVSLTGMVRGGKVTGKTSMFASITPVTIRETNCDTRYNGGNEGGVPGTYVGGCMDGMNGSVAVDQDNGYRCILWDSVDGDGDGRIQTLPTNNVASADKSYCALKQSFPKNVRFAIDVRLRTEPAGWLHGRLADPDVTFTTAAGRTNVRIAGSAVAVPTFAGVSSYDALPQNLKDYFDAICARNCHSARFGPLPPSTPPGLRALQLSPSYFSAAAASEMDLWRDLVEDAAGSLPTNWNVRTLSGGEMQRAPSCISNGAGVTGIVSTNATAYDEGPPSFDAKTKMMNYKVAAPHYESNGKTEFKGNYNLRVREDIAECLYNFSSAFAVNPKNYVAEEEPFTTAVGADDFSDATFDETADAIDPDLVQFEAPEVTDWTTQDLEEEDLNSGLQYKTLDDGTVVKVKPYNRLEDGSDVETGADPEYEPVRLVVASISADVISSLQKAASAKTKIKLEDGWFHFSATDFTFSQPTVAVEFGATPSRSIRCIAGTSVKVVTSVKPSCPAGYAAAVTQYCVKGKKVDAVIAAKPKCPRGFSAAKAIRCAKGLSVKRVVALAPKCPKSFKPMISFVCMKDDQARKVTSAVTTCAAGWAKATTLNCAKGKKKQSVTGIKPKCPKGFRKI
jgi:hypothetical protein